jgi:hypothetical protein
MKHRCATRMRGRVLLLLLMLPLLPGAVRAQVHGGLFVSSMYDDNSFSIYDKRADVYHSFFGSFSAESTLGPSVYIQGYYYGAVVLFRTYNTRSYTQHTLGAYTQIQLDHRSNDAEEAARSEPIAATDEEEDEDADGAAQADTVRVANDGEDVADEDIEDEDTAEEGSDAKTVAARDTIPLPSMSRSADVESVSSDSLVSWLFVIPQIGARLDQEEWDFYDFERGSLLLRYKRPLVGAAAAFAQYQVEFKRYPHLMQFTHLEQIGGLNMNYDLSRHLEVFGYADYGYKFYTESITDTLEDEETGEGSVVQLATPATSQLVLSAGASYRLWTSTMLALSYLRRINPLNTARYVEQVAIIGSSEDEIFDDRYGYEGHEFHLEIEGPLPARFRILGSLQYQLKYYPREATDLDGQPLEGSPLREDQRAMLQLQLMYPLTRPGVQPSLSLGVVYNFIRNQSNNAYNDYDINQVALVLSGDW